MSRTEHRGAVCLDTAGGTGWLMPIALLLITIGIVLALLVHYALGIICIVIGLVLLIWPRIAAGRGARA